MSLSVEVFLSQGFVNVSLSEQVESSWRRAEFPRAGHRSVSSKLNAFRISRPMCLVLEPKD